MEYTLDNIAILIPCYNEEKTIYKVVNDWKTVLPEAVIYVYDNNSSDKTAEFARAAGAVIRYEHQQGKGNIAISWLMVMTPTLQTMAQQWRRRF